MAPLQKCKYPCIDFNGIGGIKALLYVQESYRKTSKKLEYSKAQSFDAWELCLGDSALNHWENINDVNANADKYDNTWKSRMYKAKGQ